MTMFIPFLLMSLLFDAYPPSSRAEPGNKSSVRRPAVAGQFYPSDPEKLAKAVDSYLADAVTPFNDKPIAIVCPHAGYIYSGQIAADAYRQASNSTYDIVVVLGVNHTTAGFRGVSVYAGKGFETPLGVAPIDQDLAERIIATDKRFTFDETVHAREHSVEVQVPFVQRAFPGAKILPVVIGSSDADLCVRFGEALAGALAGRKALIVASSDLSHFPDYEGAVEVDRKTLSAMSKLDPSAFEKATSGNSDSGVSNLETHACGEASVIAAMTAAKKLGATGAEIISYANSGDTSIGNRARVVGYGAVAFVAAPPSSNLPALAPAKSESKTPTTFTAQQKTALLSFARKTIQQFLASETAPLARGFDPPLESVSGAFVTLREKGDLRGCIGHMEQDMPLCQVVGYCALQSAFNDRRFSPVEPDELARIEIEISVLTPYEPIGGYGDIQIGRDGVLMEKDGQSAVFLPSVAVEQGWNRDEMLSHLSAKAGLPPDAWKKGAKFYTFQAVAFGESERH